MLVEEMLRYAAGDGYQVVEIPYAGRALSMLLPDSGRFPAIEAALDLGALMQAVDGDAPRLVNLWLPPFAFESKPDLKAGLRALGVKDAFDDKRADLSRIAEPADLDGRLFVGDAIHQAVIEVDREGTVAAAATAIIISDQVSEPPESLLLQVNRPFLFLIRDVETGAPLFLGRVLDPTAD